MALHFLGFLLGGVLFVFVLFCFVGNKDSDISLDTLSGLSSIPRVLDYQSWPVNGV